MLLNERSRANSIISLKDKYFYSATHQTIFSAMASMFEKQLPIDINSVTTFLTGQNSLEEIGGEKFLSQLTENISNPNSYDFYIKIIEEKWIARELIKISESTIVECQKGKLSSLFLFDNVERNILNLAEATTKINFVKMKDTMLDTIEYIENLSKNQEKNSNNYFDNFWGGELIVVASYSTTANRDFALKLVAAIGIKTEKEIAVFSMDKTPRELNINILSAYFKIEKDKLNTGNLSEKEWEDFFKAATILKKMPIIYDCSKELTPSELRAKCKYLKGKRRELKLIVIDNFQLLNIKPENSEDEIAYISKSLKMLAMELDVTVIALSTLESVTEKSSRPELKELGVIEKNADVVMLLHQPKEEEISELIIAKHFNSPTEIIRNFMKHRNQTEKIK